MQAGGVATYGDIYGSQNGGSFDQSAVVGPDNADLTSGQKVTGTSGSPIAPVNLFAGLRGVTPFAGAVIVILTLVGLKLLHEWKADEGEFREIKIGLRNVLTVTVMAILGIPLFKGLAAKYHVPGVSEWVLNA